MPRVENAGPSVDDWARSTGGPSSTFDLCDDCRGLLLMHPGRYFKELPPYGEGGEPEGEYGYVGEVAHPNYDSAHYVCAKCGKKLTEERDG